MSGETSELSNDQDVVSLRGCEPLGWGVGARGRVPGGRRGVEAPFPPGVLYTDFPAWLLAAGSVPLLWLGHQLARSFWKSLLPSACLWLPHPPLRQPQGSVSNQGGDNTSDAFPPQELVKSRPCWPRQSEHLCS